MNVNKEEDIRRRSREQGKARKKRKLQAIKAIGNIGTKRTIPFPTFLHLLRTYILPELLGHSDFVELEK